MMTAKATLVLIFAYVLALAAGTTSGVLAERLRASAPVGSAAPLAAQLQLTDAQTEQMRNEWESVRGTVDDCYKQAQLIERERDQALVNLLTDEQKARFAPVDQGYKQRFDALALRRDDALHTALDKTESILTPDQRVKYEQIVRDRIGRSLIQSAGSSSAGSTTEPSIEDFRP
jgi:Spy/CpxP family protein refolding chaperone